MFTGSRPNWIKVRGDVDKERKTKMEGLRVCLKKQRFVLVDIKIKFLK